MKPIKFPSPAAPAEVTNFQPPRPPPPPPPPPAPPGMTKVESPLPPPPVAMPPPESTTKFPESYEEYVTLARGNGRQQQMEMRMLFASLAQADAMNRAANALGSLADYFHPIPAEDHHGELEAEPSLFSQEVSQGIQEALHSVKDDLLALVPPEALEIFKAQLNAKIEEMVNPVRGMTEMIANAPTIAEMLSEQEKQEKPKGAKAPKKT